MPALFDDRNGIIGGAERYVFELARHMANQVPTRFVALGKRDRHETAGNLQIRVIGGTRHVRGQSNNPLALRERIVWLCEHPSEAATMGVAARQRVLERFTCRRSSSVVSISTVRPATRYRYAL